MTLRVIRLLLILAALPIGWYGVSLIWDMMPGDKMSILVWLIGGLIVHDAIFAPACIAAGHGVKRILPRHWWPPVLAGASATVILLLLAFPVIYPRPASKMAPGNEENLTIIDRPYGLSLTIAVLVIWILVVVLVARNRARPDPDHPDPDDATKDSRPAAVEH